MKRKLFLMNMFLSTSLLGGTVFNIISCKTTVKPVEESNETTEITIKEKTALIKQKIRVIIDNYTTDSNDKNNKDWIIDLSQIHYSKIKIESLKKAVKNLKDSTDGKLVSEVDLDLNEIIKAKIKQISQYVTDKIKIDNTLNLSSDFQVEIIDDFKPMLTNFTSINFMQAVKKLLGVNSANNSLDQINSRVKTYQSFNSANKLEDQAEEIGKIDTPDIFKINANFSYTFNYAGINETDEYKNVELLVTNDVYDTNVLRDYTHQQIERIFNEFLQEQFLIYDGDVNNDNISGQNYENLNTKFNWDFKDINVQNEILGIQIQKIRNIIKKNAILKSLEFDQEETKFEVIDAMNFSNESIKKPLTPDDNTINLVYGSVEKPGMTPFSSIKKNLLKQLGISEREKNSVGFEEYYFNKNGEDHYWDGGELNKSYVDNLKNRGLIKEFYNENSRQYLVAFADLFIPKITFANLQLSSLVIKNNIAIDGKGFSNLIVSLLKYLEGLINVLQNSDEPKKPGYAITTVVPYTDDYMIQWKFYDDEWKAIKEKIASTSSEQISFNWIMENIIYKLRAPNSKHKSINNILKLEQYWWDNAIVEEGIESFKLIYDIFFKKIPENEALEFPEEVSDYDPNHPGWYFKFGPFKIFLSDTHATGWYTHRPIAKGKLIK